jgi:pimeloyl-ACP methyl ester carboxylesterase
MVKRIGDVSRIHLVGHSSGGVDAQLLTCDKPLASDRWSTTEQEIRKKIRSVITIAAPHHGTCLSDAPLAQLLVDPVRNHALLPSLALPLFNLSRLIAKQADGPVIASYMLANLPESARFVAQLMLHRGLVQDLAPRSMAAIRANSVCTHKPFTRSFVTVTPVVNSADPFFRELRALTADTSKSPADALVKQALDLLRASGEKMIRNPGAAIEFTDGISDGVVNSARQLLDPSDPKELAGIVVADHADVIGHYDRTDALMSEEPLNLGLFHSGAAFGDDQFFELYRRVGNCILQSVREL